MKSKTINNLSGALLFLIAFFAFLSGGEYGYVVALMLFLDGASCFLLNARSEFNETLSRTLRRISLATAVVLLVKILIID